MDRGVVENESSLDVESTQENVPLTLSLSLSLLTCKDYSKVFVPHKYEEIIRYVSDDYKYNNTILKKGRGKYNKREKRKDRDREKGREGGRERQRERERARASAIDMVRMCQKGERGTESIMQEGVEQRKRGQDH